MQMTIKIKQRLYIVFIITIAIIAIIALTLTALASSPEPDQAVLPVPTDISPDAQNPPPPPDSGAPKEPIPTPGYYGTDRMIELQQKVLQATTDEERAAAYKELTEERIRAGDIIPIELSGPNTRGISTQIGGKTVQLPDDAELGGLLIEMYVPMGSEGKAFLENRPALRIIRGDSEILIGSRTGVIISGRIEPGEEGAFDFLKQYFPDQSIAIDSIPVSPKVVISSVDWGFDMPEATE